MGNYGWIDSPKEDKYYSVKNARVVKGTRMCSGPETYCQKVKLFAKIKPI